jgi:hypothetical protein
LTSLEICRNLPKEHNISPDIRRPVQEIKEKRRRIPETQIPPGRQAFLARLKIRFALARREEPFPTFPDENVV